MARLRGRCGVINSFGGLYKDKHVLVTGHTGFKGAWLSLWLKELGAEVLGYALEPPTSPSLFDSIRLEDKVIHIIGDIRDEERLRSVFHDFQPEFVFHLAAQPLVRLSYKDPKLTYETNIIGTINLFEAIRETASVSVVVNITSDKCYENKEWLYGYREIDPMGGHDPYSSSKGCAELVTSAYRNSYFNPKDFGKKHKVALSSVRAGNVIGGGDWGEDRLIPDCVKSLSQNKTISIRNPDATRPWQYVLEPLSGYLCLGALMYQNGITYSSAWNFGPNDSDFLTVEEIIKRIIHLWGEGDYKINADSRFHEATLLKLDISKADSYLKWKPVYKVNEALETTINWYKEYYNDNKKEIYQYTLNQIKEYVKNAKKRGLEWTKI